MISGDKELFYLLNSFAGISSPSDWITVFFARFFPYIVAALPLLIILKGERNTESSPFVKVVLRFYAASLAARFVVTPTIRYFWPVERPFAVLSDVMRLIPHEATASFPSGHAAFFFALSTSIWFYNRRLGIWFFAVSAAISVARIIAGVHWPSDVLAGAILGVMTAAGAEVIYKRCSAKQKT